MLIKWINKLLRINPNTNRNIDKILKIAVDNFGEMNPLQKYKDGNWVFYYGDRVEAHCECTSEQALKSFKLDSFKILEEWNGIGKCKIQFSKKEYEEVYKDKQKIKIVELIHFIRNHYNQLENKDDFDSTYTETITTFCDVLSKHNYKLDTALKNEMFLLLNDLVLEIKSEEKLDSISSIDRLKMEREYLKRIKETREFHLSSSEIRT